MSASDSAFDPNPYQPPQQQHSALVETGDHNAVAGLNVVRLLVETRPWVRFMSIFGFIIAALMILVGLVAVVFGAADPEILLPALYSLLGLLCFFPSLYLYRYASRISELEETPHVERLEAALEAQRSFWRLVGILMAIALVAYALLLIVMLGIALVGTAL